MTVSVFNADVSTLRPAQENPNSMPEARFKLLVRAIERVGFLQPVLVRKHADTGAFEIVDGHHRVRAAQELGMTAVPAVLVDNMDDATAVAERVGMNHLRGELDLTAVGRSMVELTELGWSVDDIGITGFSASEVADLMRSVSQNVDMPMATTMEMPAEDYEVEDAPVKPFELVIEFPDKRSFQKAKKMLKKAGKGDLAVGVMHLLGEEAKHEDEE